MPGFLAAWTLLYAIGTAAAPQPARTEIVIKGVDQAEVNREALLNGYAVTEHYMLRNSRFQTGAEMTVAAVYSKGVGKSYRTLSRSGSATLQRTVLDKLLQAQEEMSRGETRQRALVTSANYKMKVVGQETVSGQLCDIVEIVPRKKSPHLLTGRAWVNAEDHFLVRIEGKPSASPSFLSGRPLVVRDYDRIDGFSLARKSHALSESFLLGKTELTIDYTDYRIIRAPK